MNAFSPHPWLKRPANILVVEDSIILRFTLAESLRQLHYIVFEAASADEAITLLASPLVIDLVITDVEMPGRLNGYDLVEHIRKTSLSFPVIVVSGNLSRKKIREIDVSDFFEKPYNLDEVAKCVAKLLPASFKQDENDR